MSYHHLKKIKKIMILHPQQKKKKKKKPTTTWIENVRSQTLSTGLQHPSPKGAAVLETKV